MTDDRERTYQVDVLTRVEGEGRFHLRVGADGTVREAQLAIFEAPRFFEALLRGRSLYEVPDIVARICGICPVAYQMSSVRALESALGIVPTEPVRKMRRLMYCGEWIESHALHVFMLHAPDFLGYPSAVEMAADHRDVVEQGLRNPQLHIVFFGVGFETTAPATAMAADLARKLALANFSLLTAHVRVPPAMDAILSSERCQVQGFLAAGHVCTVEGTSAYPQLATRDRAPIVVTGFEPVDILQGVTIPG